MSEPVNPVNGVIAFLRDSEAVSARVDTRVYGPDGVPTAQNASMPRQAIVVSPAGGFGAIGGGYQNYGDRRIDIACFGKTQAESYALYTVVHALLKHLRRELVADSATQKLLLHWARCAADGVTGKDPETGWPMTLSSWQVLAGDAVVPI